MLIGYENRLLSTEDFNDDTKDAGGSVSYQMILDDLEAFNFNNDEYKEEFIYLVKKMNRYE